jgi:Uncharacterised nucleotidyltransferase
MSNDQMIRNEELLLLKLSRLEFSDEEIAGSRSLIAAVTDWQYFSSLANRHGVAALISHNLERYDLLAGIPAETVGYLKGTKMVSLSRNIFNTASLSEVFHLLDRENIKTVLLKGLALELTVYGMTGLRQMSDVDIFIVRDQCLKARKILMDSGFLSLPLKSAIHRFIMADTGKHLPSLTRGGFTVEIHNRLFGGKDEQITRRFFENSKAIELRGEKAWIPEPQLLFLHLVRHLWSHEINNESQLRLYTDLVVMIARYRDEILNEDLIGYASQLGLQGILACRLGSLREFLGITFAGWINVYIDRWYDQEQADRFRFFLKSPKDNPPSDKPAAYRHIVADIKGIHRRFLFVLGDLFPTVRFMKKRYGCSKSWQVFFYYPLRLGKIWWLIRR